MTQSLIMMVLGLGIGYSTKFFLPHLSATPAPANGLIDNLLRKAGAITVMFVDSKGELMVADAETGEELHHFVDEQHPDHPAKITLNGQDEPQMIDKKTGQAMTKPRLLHSRLIHFWRYQGSHCECIWSNGKHVVICR